MIKISYFGTFIFLDSMRLKTVIQMGVGMVVNLLFIRARTQMKNFREYRKNKGLFS